ncbi:hypothetical protein CPB83DRAFT_895412 [Crepidotus variabilis]|uniref:RING-type domain-containing protein n=1 Tax=Crepidotus variabilis TaxID=179855 RepID=A0A9P6EDV0_9AGAR|nr:hypothetical protein CPB83DRAFT_895412 [Crepidotus variabilis]
MLTLTPGSACDVCAEEYGQQRMPHSMSCGHVLCASCCTNIVEKTSPRLNPACPFCREPFTQDSLRIIRMDFTTSGWSTPHRIPAISTASEFNKVLFDQTTGSLLSLTNSKAGLGVRRLEERVARVAAKKCSVEEVSALYKELEEWIIAEKDEQTSSLVLSAALLRAILMNHLAHSEASKTSKTSESNLKMKIDELENANAKFESELRSLFDSVIQLIRQKAHYTQKSQECQQLRQEVSQLRALATTLGVSPPEMQTQRSMSPTPSAPSPTPYSSSSASSSASAAAAAASPLSRFSSSHSHSRSLSMSSRPTTPAMPTSPTRSHTPAPPRSHTPAPVPTRSHTPGPGSSYYPSRSHTPGPGSLSASVSASSVSSSRSHTPAPPSASASAYARSQTPSIRSYTPAPGSTGVPPVPRYSTPAPPSMSIRAQTPAPLVPPKPRRLSQTSPPQMYRSTSEEKADAHERWLPPASPQSEYDYSKYKSSTPRPPSRVGSHSLSSRLRDVLS